MRNKPSKPDELLLLALAAHRRAFEARSADGLRQARSMYEAILARTPKNADALHYLGVLLHQLGESEAGIARLEQAIAARPRDPDMANNLGNVLEQVGRHEDAAAAYRRGIAIRPDHADSFANLGVALKGAGKRDEAVEAFHRALELAPRHRVAHRQLAPLMMARGSFAEASEHYRRAAELDPRDVELKKLLASALDRAGKRDQARAVLSGWLAEEPGHPVASFMLASMEGAAVPERAPDAYLRATFDPFADDFDAHLTGKLGYVGPALVARALADHLAAPAGELAILDAGCGTGLSASLLRPYARTLAGVDLSPRMLDKARARGAYDELEEAEITAYLERALPRFDVIVAIDTLIYFGALEGLIAGFARALRPGGLLGITVETVAVDPPPRYRLDAHGRYVHGESYVRELLAENGMSVCSFDREEVRREGGAPVEAFVIIARR